MVVKDNKGSRKDVYLSERELLCGLLEQQGLSYDGFTGVYWKLINAHCVSTLRLEVSGRGNNYPTVQGNLVLVADVEKKIDLNKPEDVFKDLAERTEIKFNDVVALGGGGRMCAANVFGRNKIGDAKDLGTLLVVLKKPEGLSEKYF